jgi:hypothetical protein
MGIEPPLVAAGIARLPEPKLNLAAFGLCLSVVLLFESPVIQILATTTALADGRLAYLRLRSFAHILAVALTVIHLVVALTPLYALLAGRLMGVQPEVVEASRPGFLLLFPWGAAIGYRRLWQGILIRCRRTAVIPITMGVRVAAGLVVVVIGLLTGAMAGAYVGALALSVGVVSAAACAWFYARPLIRREVLAVRGSALGWLELMRFYVPLAMTTLLLLVVRPIVTTGLARAPGPLDSLALWPVVGGFLFLLNSAAISYQEVVITLLRSDPDRKPLVRFALLLSASLAVLVLVFVLTPLKDLWFRDFADLPADLLPVLETTLLVLTPIPALYPFVSMNRGVLIYRRRTSCITRAVAVNFVLVTGIMLFLARKLPFPGVVTAAGAMLIAVAAEVLALRVQAGAAPIVKLGEGTSG